MGGSQFFVIITRAGTGFPAVIALRIISRDTLCFFISGVRERLVPPCCFVAEFLRLAGEVQEW